MDDRLQQLATQQHDVVSRTQLADVGIRYWHVRDQVRARRWRLYGRQVVVLHRGELTTEQRRMVAVLELAPTAALCGLTAAAVYGLDGFDAGRVVHVVVPKGTRAHPLPWVRTHESRRYVPSRDRHPVKSPPIVTVERAVIDAAAWATTDRFACALVVASVRNGLTTPARLARCLTVAGQVRRCRVLRAVLADIEGGSQALSEIDFIGLCRRAGLPRPVQQAVRADGDGRRRYLDVLFDLPDGAELAVEIDGSVHLEPEISWDDQVRQNDLVIGGLIVMRFPSVLVRTEPARVVAQLRRAFAAHAEMPGAA